MEAKNPIKFFKFSLQETNITDFESSKNLDKVFYLFNQNFKKIFNFFDLVRFL